jgi:nucleotide-binding universal stress UspA family protein
MKKILVPCDFSKPSINAFRFALDVAASSGGTIHLINIIELPVLHDSVLMPVLDFEQALFDELKTKAEDQFKKITDKYKVEDTKIVTKVLFGGVSRMINKYIEDNNIDIVVMGSHGASGLRELFIGSNAERLVRQCPVPVLVVKDYYKGAVKDIVFPNTLDAEDQEDLVNRVKALQSFFKAKLHLVWINTPINFTADHITRKRLTEFAKTYGLKDYTINIFNHPDEETGILQFTKFIKGDLIALGTHGRKGIAHLVNGSLAEDLVNHTKGLVWTYALKREPVEA